MGSWTCITSLCDVTGDRGGRKHELPGGSRIDPASGVNVSGDLSFKSDMTFASTATLNGTATVSVPNACLMTGGFGLTCDDLGTLLLEIGQGIGGSCATGRLERLRLHNPAHVVHDDQVRDLFDFRLHVERPSRASTAARPAPQPRATAYGVRP